ncbi:MAG: hypothetical protein EOO46_16895 [Flavobacterium sp.]|nr:MAG: hypothetical protein EOO46_16895 [Flavobacterium sp.]
MYGTGGSTKTLAETGFGVIAKIHQLHFPFFGFGNSQLKLLELVKRFANKAFSFTFVVLFAHSAAICQQWLISNAAF